MINDLYPEQYKNREIWAKVIASRDINSDAMLLRSEGERITNGETSANIQRVLTGDQEACCVFRQDATRSYYVACDYSSQRDTRY